MRLDHNNIWGMLGEVVGCYCARNHRTGWLNIHWMLPSRLKPKPLTENTYFI
ncbi:hypothetical protein M23134_01937 [Microscilla marina ATCC 23134]|uniref:Uncharacterized protein n=1 Tax=Microscilla marina ATCC 23134 TaxID=313606 RepID=A1ZCA6_MICM2|nr:hypothetical protein M23134_01937 [Microscilla marina ATCC 23134]